VGKIITLKEYAERHGKDPVVVRQKAIRGTFQTATKFGCQWVIDEDEPYIDHRVKSGRYINSRNKAGEKTEQ